MKIKYIILSIISITSILLIIFYNIASPKFEVIASSILDKEIKKNINDYKEYISIDTNNLLIIEKNSKEEIIYMSYNMNKIYEIANEIIRVLESKNEKLEQGILTSIPIGTITNNIFLSRIGPKIPIKIHFVGNSLAEIKTDVTNYGLNNALIKIILVINISYQIITPIKYPSKELSYEIILDTIITQGSVPNWYNNLPKEKVFLEI